MLLKELKENGQDFEWYPTTDEIMLKVAKDIYENRKFFEFVARRSFSVLDIGCGDGRVLKFLQEYFTDEEKDSYTLKEIECYGIEKSIIHIKNLPKDVVILGTDFIEQTLIDKPAVVIFSNPPYSEFKEWMSKIIREAQCKVAYLVVPQRWKDDVVISEQLTKNSIDVSILGEYDFENAERRARAKVNLLKLDYPGESIRDPFEQAVLEMLPELDSYQTLPTEDEEIDNLNQLISGSDDLVKTLVSAYVSEFNSIIDAYTYISKIKYKFWQCLGLSREVVCAKLKSDLQHLKDKYWKVLFERFKPITTRLATKQRKLFLDSIVTKSHIDFTEKNIGAVLIWVSKQANSFFDEQLVQLYLTLVEKCNVHLYKSNKRTWQDQQWRYINYEFTDYDYPTHFYLDYRVVLSCVGGIYTGEYTFQAINNLTERAYNFLQDLICVANNLGFYCQQQPDIVQWKSGQAVEFKYDDKVLMRVKAFKNQNIHIQFNQRFILALNVEAGRLLGWLNSPEEAVQELSVPNKDVQFVMDQFKSNFSITGNTLLRIDYSNERS